VKTVTPDLSLKNNGQGNLKILSAVTFGDDCAASLRLFETLIRCSDQCCLVSPILGLRRSKEFKFLLTLSNKIEELTRGAEFLGRSVGIVLFVVLL
jgi:hypothetical protein